MTAEPLQACSMGSSSVATSAIIASAMAGSGSLDLAGALLAQGPSAAPTSRPSTRPPAPSAPVPASPGARRPPRPPPARPLPLPLRRAPKRSSRSQSRDRARSPRPGRVKHVFVISLTSPGYEKSFGTTPRCRTSRRPFARRASCSATTADQREGAAELHRDDQRPAAEPQTSQDCPSYSLFPPSAAPNEKGFVGARAACTRCR